MKKITHFLAIIIILLISCSEKQNKRSINDEVGLDDSIARIKVIKLNYGKGIIFPAAYAKQVLIHSNKVLGVFTPDEKTIRYIDENLASNFDSIITPYQKQNPNFSIFEKNLAKYDKQFLGYIDSKKDSVILGLIFNFESDPYNIKRRIEKEFMIGADGWNDTNTCEFRFLKNSKRFANSLE